MHQLNNYNSFVRIWLNQPLQHSTKLICAHMRFYLCLYSNISVLKQLLNYLKNRAYERRFPAEKLRITCLRAL